ncbi:hypothetical protein C0T31_00120 [Dysgonamonadaceae bacterium]|nr:hypothetical protein C0T31_00120 [Dysgonamonadaceae bacterium]
MNLQSKIAAILLFAFGMITYESCDSLIYEDMNDCPQGVYVKFYSKTPCDVDSLYPSDIKNLRIYVFDANDVFVKEYAVDNVTLSNNFEFLIPLEGFGMYSFIAWSGIDDRFTVNSLQPGKTIKDEALLQLKCSAEIAENLEGTKLYMGTSPSVLLPDPQEYGSYYAHTAVNMLEITNRIQVIVEGFAHPEDYTVYFTIHNGNYTVKGNIIEGEHLNYYCSGIICENNLLTANFTTLKLETGFDDWLYLQTKSGETVFYQEDFLGTILMQNPEINLNCDHDFVIRFKVKEDEGTYVVVGVWVNDWQIHTYPTGIDSYQ